MNSFATVNLQNCASGCEGNILAPKKIIAVDKRSSKRIWHQIRNAEKGKKGNWKSSTRANIKHTRQIKMP